MNTSERLSKLEGQIQNLHATLFRHGVPYIPAPTEKTIKQHSALRKEIEEDGLKLLGIDFAKKESPPEKTIKQWFEEVEDEGLRELLLERLEGQGPGFATGSFRTDSFKDAVNRSFDWNRSDEGHNFWCDVATGKITTYKKKENKWVTPGDNCIEKHEIIEQEEKEWPQVGDEYWFISVDGVVNFHYYDNDEVDKKFLVLGNFYKTKEEAQAVVDLKKDIHRFEIPKKQDKVWLLDRRRQWTQIDITEGKVATGMKYGSGAFLPIIATKEDRENRLKLLKAVHENDN